MAERDNRTNVETIVDIMEYSEHGALVQAYIVQALMAYSDMVCAANPATLTSGLIEGTKWQAIAKEVKEKLEAKYAPTKTTPESELVFEDSKKYEGNRIKIDEFVSTNLTRGYREEDGKAFWGTHGTVSNKSAFEDKPTWATCVYFIPKEHGNETAQSA